MTADEAAMPDLGASLTAAEPELLERLRFLESRQAALSGNFRIYQESKATWDREWRAMVAACNAMVRDVEGAPPVYGLSRFWLYLFKQNVGQIEALGLESFKLTVNQCYHTFIVRDRSAPQFRKLLDWAVATGNLDALFASIEDSGQLDRAGPASWQGQRYFPGGRRDLATYRAYVALLWDYVAATLDSRTLLAGLSEPEPGNPFRIWHRDRLVSQDLATSAAETEVMLRYWPDRARDEPLAVAEIGAGYGRLAWLLLQTGLARRYVIVDVPPALYLSCWYLSRLFPGLRMQPYARCAGPAEMAARLGAADVHFLLPEQIALLPDGCVDIAVAISSLHEMRPDQSAMYLAQMGRIARHRLFTKQYWSYANPADEIVVAADDYAMPTGYRRLGRQVDPLNESFFAEVMVRQG